MDFRKRFLANCAEALPITSRGETLDTLIPIKFHPGEFIERLILFDECIIDSLRLSEIPHIVRIFGVEHVIELFNSKSLKIFCDSFFGHGSTGRTSALLESRRKKGDLPLCSYCLDALNIHPFDETAEKVFDYEKEYDKYQKEFIHRDLQQLNRIPDVNSKLTKKLRKAVADNIKQFSSPSVSKSITESSYFDIRNNDPTIKVAIGNSLKNLYGLEIQPTSIELEISFIDDTDFRVESNLKDLTHLDIESIHGIIERALLAITNRNHKIAKMKDLEALVGYKNEEESLIFSGHLESLIKKMIDPARYESNFFKVVSAKGLPDFEKAALAGEIDLIKIIAIRESRECIEFRNWLWGQETIDEKQLKEALESFIQLFIDFRSTTFGKIISLMIATGFGELLDSVSPYENYVTSLGLGVLDQFVIQRLLPVKGPLTFINNQLTTIYTDPYFLYKTKNQ